LLHYCLFCPLLEYLIL